MSVWPTGDGTGGGGAVSGGNGSGGAAGAGGQAAGGSGGDSFVVVKGGTRDVATAQCTSTSGSTCPVSSTYLQCVKNNCGSALRSCYPAGSSSGGLCREYAECLLACPCDSGRSKCEDGCLQNRAIPNIDCSMCLATLFTCSQQNGCPLPTDCSTGTT